MKKIEAIIRYHKLDEVRNALVTLGVQGITVSEVRGSGHTPSHTEVYRGLEYAVDFTPRIKLEVAVADIDCSHTVRTIVTAARTGEVGDGCVLVMPLDEAVRVRTGETGDDAL
ncbi:P-II family nitrogen regulator [bacterium]|nr:P-II family nitrogen regulator [bacterium]